MRFAPKKGKFVFSLGVLCALAMPMTNVFGEAGYCGDGSCNFGEDCGTCPEDCPCEEGEVCVDGQCVGDIPTVSEWGLIVMTLLALTAGTIVFARRRRPTMA